MKEQSQNSPFPDLNIRPFRLERSAKHRIQGDELVSNGDLKEERYADILGAEFFQARDDILSEIRAFLDYAEYRKKLGSIRTPPFDALSEVDEVMQANALKIAEFAMDQLIRRTAQTLECSIRNYPGDYWVEFEVLATTYKVTDLKSSGPKLKKVETVKVTSLDNLRLSSSYGRWVNSFGGSRNVS